MNLEQMKELVRESRVSGTTLNLMDIAAANGNNLTDVYALYNQATSAVEASGGAAAGTQEKQEPAEEPAPEAPETAAETVPLTEPEKEPEEVREYEIKRLLFWESYWKKNAKSLPNPITAHEQKQLVWSAVEQDVIEFKKGLYQIVGADQKPKSDTVLVFKNQEDADLIRDLGFDTVATTKGAGKVPFQVATTMLKMKYKRVLFVGDVSTIGFDLIHKQIEIGSMYVSESFLEELNATLNTPDLEYDADAVKKMLKDYIRTDDVQECSILRSLDNVRENVFNTLSWGLEKIDDLDPRKIVEVTMDSLGKLQTFDITAPAPLTEKSLWGILGDYVDITYPTGNASREMLLYQMLPMIGAMLGDAYYVLYGSDKHYPTIFALPIGPTAGGKGEAKHHAEAGSQAIDAAWYKSSVHSNPASGEGLVRMLADRRVHVGGGPIRKNCKLIFNSEMVTTFNAMARKDSTLSGYLRAAYDADPLENFRSNARDAVTANNYLLSFCGTITPRELKEVMPAIDWKNGSANRFLWCIGEADRSRKIRRSSVQPNFANWAKRVLPLIKLNYDNTPAPIDYSQSGGEVWDAWVDSLPEHRDDLLSDARGRNKANCVRVANLYAQLDERRLDGWKVQLEDRHIEAAIEVVTRSNQTIEWHLAQSGQVGDSGVQADVTKLKKAVAKAGRETGVPELTQSEVTGLFSHKTTEERDELCLQAGLKPYSKPREMGGKPTMVWTWNPIAN
jgi:Protein of unknown function (DUF3987)